MSSALIDTSCFIHEMPLSIRRILCSTLDRKSRWEQMAYKMGYERNQIEQIKQYGIQNSPTNKLLSLWSDHNHTVTELFMILYRMQEHKAMECIRDLVDSNYHHLILRVPKNTISSSKTRSIERSQRKSSISTSQTSKEKLSSTHSSERKSNNSNVIRMGLIFNEIPGIPQVNFTELTKATENWNYKNILGHGGYGTVFRGKWKCTEVAIKRIKHHDSNSCETTKKRMRQIMIEMRFLNSFRHDNILPLYGYSFDGSESCLVYQLMAAGSLDRRLRHNSSLTYKQRLSIAIGTARGLQFLHTFNKRPTIHGDIKSANILLDSNLRPKIGDFGLAREISSAATKKVSRIYGTRAYMPDDFIKHLTISTKNDTYSFGVVLFELATGLRPYDEQRGQFSLLTKYMWAFSDNPKNFSDLIDPRAITTTSIQSMQAISAMMQLIKIGLKCTRVAAERPEMTAVLSALTKIVI